MASKNSGSTVEGNISQYRNREILHIFNNFMHNEATGGILLLVCAIIAVILATVPGGQWFDRMWDLNASINIGSFSLEMPSNKPAPITAIPNPPTAGGYRGRPTSHLPSGCSQSWETGFRPG